MNKVNFILIFLLIISLLTACQSEPQHASTPQILEVPTTITPSISTSTTSAITTVVPTTGPLQIEDIHNGMTTDEVAALLGDAGTLLYSDVLVYRMKTTAGNWAYMWLYPTVDSPAGTPLHGCSNWAVGGVDIQETRKNYPGDYMPTEFDLRQLKAHMTIEEVMDILGPGGHMTGSGVSYFVWEMNDGRIATISLYSNIKNDVTTVYAELKQIKGGNIMDHIDTYADDLFTDISPGMSYSDAVTILGCMNSAIACIHADLYQYALADGRMVLVWYCDTNGVMTVCNAEFA